MHWNHNAQFENRTHTVAAFTLNHDHEMSISAWGYYLSCSAVSKRLCMSTVKYSVWQNGCLDTSTGWSPGDFLDVVNSNFKHHSMASPGVKTVFIFNQSFCYTFWWWNCLRPAVSAHLSGDYDRQDVRPAGSMDWKHVSENVTWVILSPPSKPGCPSAKRAQDRGCTRKLWMGRGRETKQSSSHSLTFPEWLKS